jgi:hypothetical protein
VSFAWNAASFAGGGVLAAAAGVGRLAHVETYAETTDILPLAAVGKTLVAAASAMHTSP